MSEKVKKPIDREHFVEIIVIVLLGITAVLTAWATWIGALHGGNQSTNYTLSSNYTSEGNSMFSEANQNLIQDMMTWNDINDILVEQRYAESKNDKDAQEKYDWMLQQKMKDNVSDGFQEAINWAIDQSTDDEIVSPFTKEGYVDSYFTEANDKLAQAEQILEQGKEDNKNGDTYGLVTVVFSVVLFLLGIIGTFKGLKNKYAILSISVVALVVATAFMCTIPLPTGFSFFSFFGG